MGPSQFFKMTNFKGVVPTTEKRQEKLFLPILEQSRRDIPASRFIPGKSKLKNYKTTKGVKQKFLFSNKNKSQSQRKSWDFAEKGPQGGRLIRYVMNQLGDSGLPPSNSDKYNLNLQNDSEFEFDGSQNLESPMSNSNFRTPHAPPSRPSSSNLNLNINSSSNLNLNNNLLQNDVGKLNLITKENARLTELHQEQCNMFESEMQYLKQKLQQYKKENSELSATFKQNELLMVEKQREKDLIHEKSNLLNDKIETYRAQVEQLYAQTKSEQEKLSHLEDCLARLRESQQQAVHEQSEKEREYQLIICETEKCKNELQSLDDDIKVLNEKKMNLTKAQSDVSNKRSNAQNGNNFLNLNMNNNNGIVGMQQFDNSQNQNQHNLQNSENLEILDDCYSEIANLKNELALLEKENCELVGEQDENKMREELFTWKTR